MLIRKSVQNKAQPSMSEDIRWAVQQVPKLLWNIDLKKKQQHMVEMMQMLRPFCQKR